jgi:hypothetical protein
MPEYSAPGVAVAGFGLAVCAVASAQVRSSKIETVGQSLTMCVLKHGTEKSGTSPKSAGVIHHCVVAGDSPARQRKRPGRKASES